MKTASMFKTAAVLLAVGAAQTLGWAKPVIATDFSKGDFAALGWKAEGAWDIFEYKDVNNNPGPVARFTANQPGANLSKTFAEVKNPKKLVLSLNVGWGWGDAAQGADSISFMLLDANGNGYVFLTARTKANWAVQWAKVANRAIPKDKTWASEEIDGTQASIREGGGLNSLTVTRTANGTWTFQGKGWNLGAGGSVSFTDATTSSFTELVLLGTQNFDEQAFGKIALDVTP